MRKEPKELIGHVKDEYAHVNLPDGTKKFDNKTSKKVKKHFATIGKNMFIYNKWSRLKLEEKAVYIIILSHCNKKNICKLLLFTISEESNLLESVVLTTLNKLVQNKLIKYETETSSTGKKLYRFSVTRDKSKSSFPFPTSLVLENKFKHLSLATKSLLITLFYISYEVLINPELQEINILDYSKDKEFYDSELDIDTYRNTIVTWGNPEAVWGLAGIGKTAYYKGIKQLIEKKFIKKLSTNRYEMICYSELYKAHGG